MNTTFYSVSAVEYEDEIDTTSTIKIPFQEPNKLPSTSVAMGVLNEMLKSLLPTGLFATLATYNSQPQPVLSTGACVFSLNLKTVSKTSAFVQTGIQLKLCCKSSTLHFSLEQLTKMPSLQRFWKITKPLLLLCMMPLITKLAKFVTQQLKLFNFGS